MKKVVKVSGVAISAMFIMVGCETTPPAATGGGDEVTTTEVSIPEPDIHQELCWSNGLFEYKVRDGERSFKTLSTKATLRDLANFSMNDCYNGYLAEKIKNDRLKTQLEVELKDRMNDRDNQVKKETMAEELKQRKNELLANKIESGAVLAANVGKNVLNYNLLGGVISGEYSGYTFRSNATKMAMDLAKAGPIKTRF